MRGYLVFVVAMLGVANASWPYYDNLCHSPDNSTYYKYFPKNRSFHAVDSKTGQQKWAFLDINSELYNNPPIEVDVGPDCMTSGDGSVVYVSNSSFRENTSVFALDADSGAQHWAAHNFPEEQIMFDPSISRPDAVFFLMSFPWSWPVQMACGGVWKVDGKTGDNRQLLWKNMCPVAKVASPDKMTIYVSSRVMDGSMPLQTDVYAYDAVTFDTKWTFGKHTDDPVKHVAGYNLEPKSTSPDGLKVYIHATEGTGPYFPEHNITSVTYIVDSKTGKQIGRQVDPPSPPQARGVATSDSATLDSFAVLV